MALHYFFLGLIGAISVIHLLTVGSRFLKKWQIKIPGIATRLTASSSEGSDWYVFFHCTDLWGSREHATKSERNLQNRPTPMATHKSAKRPQPKNRLSVSL